MAKSTTMEDVAPIVAEPNIVKLSTGYQVLVVRLKTRQFFRLLKILTHGTGNALLAGGLDFTQDAEAFGRSLLTMIAFSIPDAEDETISFIMSMCHPPPGSINEEKPPSQLSKQDRERNDEAWALHARELNNPELDDMITIIESIVRAEAPEIQSLGKRVQSMLNLYQRTGQDQEPASPQLTDRELHEQEAASASPSISSPVSTDGATSESSASPSAGSARSSAGSKNGGTGSSAAAPG